MINMGGGACTTDAHGFQGGLAIEEHDGPIEVLKKEIKLRLKRLVR